MWGRQIWPPWCSHYCQVGETMQAANKHHMVQNPSDFRLPHLSCHCSQTSPFFLCPSHLFTSTMINSTLSKLLAKLGLNPASYGFYCFRRSGVSWAADNNVPLQDLEVHGGWASAAIYSDLNHTPSASSTVALTFKKLLST